MQSRIHDLFFNITASLLGNLIWQVAIAIFPLILGLIFRAIGAQWTIILLAIGWSSSLIGFVVWFENHRQHRKERMIAMGRMMFVSDHDTNVVLAKQIEKLTIPDIRREVEYLLTRMCDLLAYRFKTTLKGASVLILESNTSDEYFKLYAGVRHEEVLIAQEIHTMLRKDNSLAGQALEVGFVSLRDCRKSSPDIKWVNTHDPPRYIGRAATPIQVVVRNERIPIGVLCFDIKRPHILTPEDQEIMKITADKIASLWIQNQRGALLSN